MAKKRIGILTGGGDVPGLNSVIKSVVYRGAELGYEVVGIRRGSILPTPVGYQPLRIQAPRRGRPPT